MVTIDVNANNSERRRERHRADAIRAVKAFYISVMFVLGHVAAYVAIRNIIQAIW
ncbi:MAG: hypothetical protein IPO08_22125 [Xanthomonadales bacterium]|nr:hypothetical protein [Xanthomonadales bacterium]